MAEAQFIPGHGAGNIIGALSQGVGTGLSLMERGQDMRLRKQQAQIAQAEEQRRAQQFEILGPAMAAKAKADEVQARVAVAGLEQTETARAAATALIPTARSEFDNLMTYADPDTREQAGLEWIGKYGHLENVGEYAKEFAAKKDIVAKLHTEATALRHLREQIAGQKEIATIRGQTAVETANIRSSAPDKIERYRARLKEAQESGDAEAVELYSGLLQKASASPINTALGSEQMQRKLEEAKASGDADEVDFWQKRINALNQRGVRKDPAALVDAIVKGLGGTDTPTAPAAGAKPAPASTPSADPFAKIKL